MQMTQIAPPQPAQLFRQRLLDETGFTQAHLARLLGISCPRLNMVLKRRCQISPEIALRVERVFGISAEYWLRLRANYELAEKRKRMRPMLTYLTPLSPQVRIPVDSDHRTSMRSDAIGATPSSQPHRLSEARQHQPTSRRLD